MISKIKIINSFQTQAEGCSIKKKKNLFIFVETMLAEFQIRVQPWGIRGDCSEESNQGAYTPSKYAPDEI